WLGLTTFRGRSLLSAVIHAGMGLPPVIVGLVVYLLLSRSGPLAFLEWLFTPQAMILAQTILAFPFVIGITMASCWSWRWRTSGRGWRRRSWPAIPTKVRWTRCGRFLPKYDGQGAGLRAAGGRLPGDVIGGS